MNGKRRIVGFGDVEAETVTPNTRNGAYEKALTTVCETLGMSYSEFRTACKFGARFIVSCGFISGFITLSRLVKALTKWLNRH